MDQASLIKFLHLLQVPVNSISTSGNWVRSSCPLSRKLHPSGQDERPSFGVVANEIGESGWHCFSADTRVITSEGISAISHLVGRFPRLLDGTGQWVKSEVLSFGKQTLWKLTVRRNKQIKEILTTQGHRWFVRYGSGKTREFTSDKLLPHHRLCSSLPLQVKISNVPETWVARGFVFGDGTRQRHHSKAYFYGKKDLPLLPYFSFWGKTSSADRHRDVLRIFGLPWHFKDLPDIDDEPRHLYGWLQGYFAADGCVDTRGCVILASSKKKNLEAVRNICTRLGIGTYGITYQVRRGYGKVDAPLFFIRLDPTGLTKDFFILPHHKAKFRGNPIGRFRWSVVKIEKTERKEEVFCAVVPGTSSFTLEDNILTGNCFVCGSGPLSHLVHRYTWAVGYDPKIHDFYGNHEVFYGERRTATGHSSVVPFSDPYFYKIQSNPVPVPLAVLEELPFIAGSGLFEARRCAQYLLGRGILMSLIEAHGLRCRIGLQGVIFPVKDLDARTYMLHVRSRIDKHFFYLVPEMFGLDITPWGRKDAWFGMELVDFGSPLVLVESEIDVLRLQTLNCPNVIASCGPPSVAKLRRLAGASNIYLGFDSDEQGVKYCETVIRLMHSSARLFRISWKDVGHKDAGELKDDNELEKVLKAARPIRVEGGEIIVGDVAVTYLDKH